MNKEIIQAIKSTKNVSELKKLAAEKGYNLSDAEANDYFKAYHAEGQIDVNVLDNVASGGCGEWCRGGSRYSSDEPHKLITTLLNHCDLYEREKEDLFFKTCSNCKNIEGGLTKYCKVRTFYNDPINPYKG